MTDMDELKMKTDEAFIEFKDKLEEYLKPLEGMSAWFNYCGYVAKKFKDCSLEFWQKDKPW